MILIFEGPDNGGKSTICKLLTEQYEVNFDKFIRHHNPTEMLIQVMETLQHPEERGWDKGVTVLDRWYYPSDINNERVYTGEVSILEPYRKRIEDALKKLDTHLIYVVAPIEVIKERYDKRGDEFVGFDQIAEVYEAYIKFMEETSLPVMMIYTDTSTPQECVDKIATKFQLTEKGGE